MSTTISRVISELFEAPLRAATDVESRYRVIWADWIQSQSRLFQAAGPLTPESIASIIDLAPGMKLDDAVDIAINIRIDDIKELELSPVEELQLGASQDGGGNLSLEVSGSESSLRVGTRFSLSNADANLRQFLTVRGLVPSNAAELSRVSQLLRSNTTPLSNGPTN